MPIKTITTLHLKTQTHTRDITIPRCFAPHLKNSSWDILGTTQHRIHDRVNCLLAHDVSALNAAIDNVNTQLANLGCTTSTQDSDNTSPKARCEQSLKQLNQITQQWQNIIDSYQTIANAKGYSANDDTSFIQALKNYHTTLQTITIEAHIDLTLLNVQQSNFTQAETARVSDIQTLMNQLPTKRNHNAIQSRFTSLLLFIQSRQQTQIDALTNQQMEQRSFLTETKRTLERQAELRYENYRHNINQLKRENAWVKGRLLQTQQRFEAHVNHAPREEKHYAFSYINGHMIFPSKDKPLYADRLWPFKPEDYKANGLHVDTPADIKADKPLQHRLSAFKQG